MLIDFCLHEVQWGFFSTNDRSCCRAFYNSMPSNITFSCSPFVPTANIGRSSPSSPLMNTKADSYFINRGIITSSYIQNSSCENGRRPFIHVLWCSSDSFRPVGKITEDLIRSAVFHDKFQKFRKPDKLVEWIIDRSPQFTNDISASIVKFVIVVPWKNAKSCISTLYSNSPQRSRHESAVRNVALILIVCDGEGNSFNNAEAWLHNDLRNFQRKLVVICNSIKAAVDCINVWTSTITIF